QPVPSRARPVKLALVKVRFHVGERSLFALMFFDRSSIARVIQLTVIRVIYPAIGLCHGRMGKLHLVIFFKKTGQTGINITLGCGWCYGVRLRRSWSSAGTGDLAIRRGTSRKKCSGGEEDIFCHLISLCRCPSGLFVLAAFNQPVDQ